MLDYDKLDRTVLELQEIIEVYEEHFKGTKKQLVHKNLKAFQSHTMCTQISSTSGEPILFYYNNKRASFTDYVTDTLKLYIDSVKRGTIQSPIVYNSVLYNLELEIPLSSLQDKQDLQDAIFGMSTTSEFEVLETSYIMTRLGLIFPEHKVFSFNNSGKKQDGYDALKRILPQYINIQVQV